MSIPFFREPNQVLVPNIPRSTVVVTQPVAFTPPPPLSEWTWVNQGPYDDPTNYPLLVTAEVIPGGIRFTVPAPTKFGAVITSNDPLPEPPYTITMAFRAGIIATNMDMGIILRNSSTGYGIVAEPYLSSSTSWTSLIYDFIATPESFSYPNGVSKLGGVISPLYNTLWLRMQNDGSEIHFFVSPDARSFIEIGGIDSSILGILDEYGLLLYNNAATYADTPITEEYASSVGEGRVVVDLLSIEVVPELLITTSFVI